MDVQEIPFNNIDCMAGWNVMACSWSSGGG